MKSLPPSTYSRLYDEADEQHFELLAEPICPLYHALGRIEHRYDIGDSIGKGGMKQVYKVYDQQTERHVAMAVPKLGMPPEQYDAFLREAHITSRLEHPNIIKLFDMGLDAELVPFFTMEFKRGMSLRKILSQLQAEKATDDYPHERRLSIFLRVCEAMAYAHSRHVLHLDIKPGNIQVGTFGEVQVCDWGMGEIERGDSEQHVSEALLDPDLYGDQLDFGVKGTPGYMAPEQEDPRSVKTKQTDIFALGCLLYELSTLQTPAARATRPPSSPAIAAIINKACAENPHDRYLSVDAMWSDVNRHLTGYSTQVEDAGFLRELRLFYRRNKLPCIMAICSVVILLGAGLWFTEQLRTSYDKTAVALSDTEVALATAEQERDRAELALTKYLKEKEYASALLEHQSGNLVDGSLVLLDNIVMNESISLVAVQNVLEQIDKVLASKPPKSSRLWTLKAYTLFMIQRFEEAEKFYAVREGDQHQLHALIPEFAPHVDTRGLLPVDEFVRLIKRLLELKGTNRAPLIEKMIICDSLKRESLAEKGRIVQELLKLSNPQWMKTKFELHTKTKSLRIGGEQLKTLYRPRVPPKNSNEINLSMLRVLHLDSLALWGGGLRNLKQLDGMKLRRLDISQIPARDLTPLVTMKSLRELVIREGQYRPNQLAQLPGEVVVTTVKFPVE